MKFEYCFRKPQEKSKSWEKLRRERLNKTFDILAALLPQYDTSKPFSKIEILQRSIVLIEDLQKEKKDLLAGNNKELLSKILFLLKLIYKIYY